jgi:hypothetical protein
MPNSGPCTHDLNPWSWGALRLNFSPIKEYILGQEHYDFDYYQYVNMPFMMEAVKSLVVGDEDGGDDGGGDGTSTAKFPIVPIAIAGAAIIAAAVLMRRKK